MAAQLLHQHVPGIPNAEVELVSRTAVGIAMGMLHASCRAHPPSARTSARELVYVLSVVVVLPLPACRGRGLAASPTAPIQPSRMPVDTIPMIPPAYPALAPNQRPATTA